MADDIRPEGILTKDKHVGHEDFRRTVFTGSAVKAIPILAIYPFYDIQHYLGLGVSQGPHPVPFACG
jgi:hypothetical protein